MSYTISYRGDVVPKDVSAHCASTKINRNIRTVSWAPVCTKLGIDYQPLVALPGDLVSTEQSCTMAGNTTAISSVYARGNYKFDRLFSKRAFVHWYVG